MTDDTAWFDLLEEFRRLGGTADNICLRDGQFGRGLFAIDPTLPVLLRVPENLLLPVEEATFEGDNFRVAENSKMGNAEKAWFEHYMQHYSWGGGGRTEVENYLGGLAALPQPVRHTLDECFSIFCPAEPSSAAIQKRFLDSRIIADDKRKVVMPIVELINHGPYAKFDLTNGVAVGGKFANEILVSYGIYDPFLIYQNWGFPSAERIALTLPLSFDTVLGELKVSNDLTDSELFEVPGTKVKIRMPKLTKSKAGIDVSFLLLGWKGCPKIPMGAFHRVFREAGHTMSDELFEKIRYTNRALFLDLLTQLKEVEGPASSALTLMCRYQLDALTHAFGVREF